uniref:PTB domain-containing protein n=1 Tax=Ditylenchus dipsaci TaxID=166011 RepID=A0A915D8A7_9BILA
MDTKYQHSHQPAPQQKVNNDSHIKYISRAGSGNADSPRDHCASNPSGNLFKDAVGQIPPPTMSASKSVPLAAPPAAAPENVQMRSVYQRKEADWSGAKLIQGNRAKSVGPMYSSNTTRTTFSTQDQQYKTNGNSNNTPAPVHPYSSRQNEDGFNRYDDDTSSIAASSARGNGDYAAMNTNKYKGAQTPAEESTKHRFVGVNGSSQVDIRQQPQHRPNPLLYSSALPSFAVSGSGPSWRSAAQHLPGSLTQRSGSPRSVNLYFGQSRRSSMTSIDGVEVIFHHHPVFMKDTSKYWYKPKITREDAITMLKQKPAGQSTPAGVEPGDGTELVRHFLIEPSSKGVKLKGLFPEHLNSNQALLERGAACNVSYLCSVGTESLTGPEALRRSTVYSFDSLARGELLAVPVHFKVSAQGITLTDNTRTLFFRRHFPANLVTYAGIDPENRLFDNNNVSHLPSTYVRQAPIFGFVARK